MLVDLDPPSEGDGLKCWHCPRRGASVRMRSRDNFGGTATASPSAAMYVLEWVTLCDTCAGDLEDVL